jgi:hypothetical protein
MIEIILQSLRQGVLHMPVLLGKMPPPSPSLLPEVGTSLGRISRILPEFSGVFPEAGTQNVSTDAISFPPIEPENKTVPLIAEQIPALELIMDNRNNHEPEPEDEILVNSGLLPHLITRARREPPALNWRQELDEL